MAELKYAAKNEPLAVAEALQHANMLRRIEQGRAVTPVVISQFSGWIRAAVNELAGSALQHVEVDLLQERPGFLRSQELDRRLEIPAAC